MRNWATTAAVALLVLAPGRAALADRHEGTEEADEAGKIYLDEEYEQSRDWAIGIGIGLVELGDNFVQGGVAVADDDVEQYLTLSLRIPIGDNDTYRSGGFRGYLEPELAYWDGDVLSDLLFGVNLVGGMRFDAVEFYVGGGIGMHFLDSDLVLPGGQDSDDALGVNAHFGLDVSLNRTVSLFGTGRFDLIDDRRDELEGKAAVGLRFHF